jgi:hypothetical protein
LVQTESGAPAITQTAPEGEVKGSALPTTIPTSSSSEPVKLASGAVPHDLDPTNPESFPKGTRPEVVKSVIDWSKANPEQAAALAAENKVFVKNLGAGDNGAHSAWGANGRRAVINAFNNGQPIGSDANYHSLMKESTVGVPPSVAHDVIASSGGPQVNGVTSRNGRLGIPAALDENGKLFQAGMRANGELNMGTVNSKIAKGAAMGLVMGLPMVLNAKTLDQAGGAAANAALGIAPPVVQALTYSGDVGKNSTMPEPARDLRVDQQLIDSVPRAREHLQYLQSSSNSPAEYAKKRADYLDTLKFTSLRLNALKSGQPG